jgi:phosphoglycerol transferase MdoB-like AlkP superfamily enzyme
MNSMEEPFVTAMFTASSHHPFNIPAEYKETFTAGGDPFLKCVQYTDYALQQFFGYAEKQPWYGNTLFVITADHTNHSIEERYRTPSGEMEVPVIFFSPQGEAPFEPGIDSTMIAQQIDIMPTVLEYVGCDNPFIAFGKSLISTPAKESFAVNYANETYRYYKGEHILLYNGENDTPLSMFNLRNDIMMKNNIIGSSCVQHDMVRELQAIIQQYMERMTGNRLTIENDTIK